MKKESHSFKKKKLINLHSMKSKQAFIMLIVMLVQIFTPIMKVEAESNTYDIKKLWNMRVFPANTFGSNAKLIMYPGDIYIFNSYNFTGVVSIAGNVYRDGNIFSNPKTATTIATDVTSYTIPNENYYYLNQMRGVCGGSYYDGDSFTNGSSSEIGLITLQKIHLSYGEGSCSIDDGLIKKGDNYSNLVPYGRTYYNDANKTGLPSPTKEGFVFDGWYTEEEGGTKVTDETTFTGTSDTTLYAHWIQVASYSVNEDLTYTGQEQTGITYDSDTTNITGTYKATNVGDYTATLTPKDGYVWSDDKTTDARVVNWSISKQSLTIPTLSNTAKSFTDSEQSPTITGYDENTMTQTGTASAKDAGNYTITWNLKDSDNYKWNDDTITEKSANWSIGTVDIPDSMIKFEDNEVTYDGDEHSIKITGNLPGGTIEYSTDGVNYSETLPTFTDVGEYTIYYRASKSNYNDKTGSNTLKINQKALTEYTIIIENQVYTGDEIKPTIIIKDGDRIVPSTEYELEFEDNIGPGTGKVVVKNKDGGNYIFSTKNATFMIIDPGKVEFIDPTTPNSNNAKVIDSADEVIAKIDFTDEDLDKINQGKNIDVYLEVKDINNSISSSDKSKIEEKLGNDKLGLYLDVSLFKKVDGEEATKITETKTPITISFEIPDELINKDSNVERTFKVLRLHDGNVEEIEVKVNGNIATFETDKFSTYALTYNDVITTSNPHTGDNIGTSFVMLIISSLGLISTLGYIVISNKRKLVKTNN